jgi:AAA+ ATPase superfamily predicted ATPase
MKPIINYFPTHLALGHAFCNRKQELKQLRYNIEGINPVLIMSPRRYGKTSLALNTLELFGKEFVTRINISLSSISRALTALLGKDYIYIDKEGYHIILDPLLRDALIV